MTVWTVTGAAGFIGSNLSTMLLDNGHRVVGIDDFSTGLRSNVDMLAARGGNRFRFVEGDIRSPEDVATALGGADCVVHLAAQVSVQKSIHDPVESDSINVGGFVSIVHGAASAGVNRVIYASSCAVYGDNPNLPLTEEEPPRPLSPYAVSKYANELYADMFSLLNPELDIVGLRFFNIFGPRQDSTSGYAAVIARWIRLLLDGKQANIFGDGGATRDFCHVDNVAAAIMGLGALPTLRPHRVYNIGTGVRTTLTELHCAIVDAIGAGGAPVQQPAANHLPWNPGDIVHSVASIDRAVREISYAPEVSLAKGLRKLLAEEYGLAAA